MLFFYLMQRTQLSIQACRVLYATVLRATGIQNACTRVSLQRTRVQSVPLLRALKNIKFGLNFEIFQDQIEELGVQSYLTLAELDFVHRIVHTNRMKVEVKTFFLWIKFKMVSFIYVFELFIEIIFLKWVFPYSS